jgi:endo-1,4-beta-xylanase
MMTFSKKILTVFLAAGFFTACASPKTLVVLSPTPLAGDAPQETVSPTAEPSLTLTIAPTGTKTPQPTSTTTAYPLTPVPTSTVPLRELALAHAIDLGAAAAVDWVSGNNQYRKILAREYSMLTPENAMKFDAVEPEQGKFDFTNADMLVDFALKNGMKVRGHTLVWDQALPDWVLNGKFTQAEWVAILKNHIVTEVGHYKGKVYAWDVVNEGLAPTGVLAKTIWRDGVGQDYIELAFRTAREADPDALLFYNEYGAEGMNAKSDGVYNLVKDLKAKGLIDGVGLQMHITNEDGPTQEELVANMVRLGDLGLIVHITELDVRLPVPATVELLDQQAVVYKDIFQACISVSACKAVITWGFTDAASWIPYTFPDYGAGLLFDGAFRPKPAYYTVWEALKE